jgi:hypothetical protein
MTYPQTPYWFAGEPPTDTNPESGYQPNRTCKHCHASESAAQRCATEWTHQPMVVYYVNERGETTRPASPQDTEIEGGTTP